MAAPTIMTVSYAHIVGALKMYLMETSYTIIKIMAYASHFTDLPVKSLMASTVLSTFLTDILSG